MSYGCVSNVTEALETTVLFALLEHCGNPALPHVAWNAHTHIGTLYCDPSLQWRSGVLSVGGGGVTRIPYFMYKALCKVSLPQGGIVFQIAVIVGTVNSWDPTHAHLASQPAHPRGLRSKVHITRFSFIVNFFPLFSRQSMS